MPYNTFTLEKVEETFGLTTRIVPLFPAINLIEAPAALTDLIARSHRIAALVSEKARSEFIVAPILLALEPMLGSDQPLSIYSGHWLEVDPARGLTGECDFIIARTQPVPRLKAPLLTILEAKRGDIELGLGQCAAQMIAARMFNQRAGEPDRPIYGAVTTGEAWQFLRLSADHLELDNRKCFYDNLNLILSILQHIVTS